MTVKDLVLHHFEYTFEKEAWQPPLAQAIEGLTAAQAAWTPSAPRHSIWQIVRHVLLWKRATLDAWEGKAPDYDALDRADWKEVTGDEAAWQTDLRALRDIQQRLKRRLEGQDEEAMSRPFPGEEDMNAAQRLIRFATHDIYHAGQIQYVRALQGA